MKYYTDGFTIKRNPSDIGGGYTIVDENGRVIAREIIKKVGFSVNDGELLGVVNALRMCGDGDVLSTDSMCMLLWIRHGHSRKRADLNGLITEAKRLIFDKRVSLFWEGRDSNLAGRYNEKHKKYDLSTARQMEEPPITSVLPTQQRTLFDPLNAF